MNAEFGIIWTLSVVVYFREMFQNLPEGIDKTSRLCQRFHIAPRLSNKLRTASFHIIPSSLIAITLNFLPSLIYLCSCRNVVK
jgi:hypothetical protein